MMGFSRQRRQRGSQSGFTLLEVLVALVIVGTALGASLRAVGSLTQNSDGLRSAMMATWSAENHLVRLRLAKTFPQTGKRTVDCPQGDLKLICEEEVVATPNPRIRQVRVNVYDVQYPARRIVRLVLLAFND